MLFVQQMKTGAIVKILMMVTADYASIEPQTGKLNIIGVFNQINAQEFPTSHRRMYLVIKIGGEIFDNPNPHKLSVALADEDGIEIVAIEGEFEMLSSSPGILPQHSALLEVNDAVFHRPGDYRFYVNVNDGEAEESVVMQVTQRQPDEAQ